MAKLPHGPLAGPLSILGEPSVGEYSTIVFIEDINGLSFAVERPSRVQAISIAQQLVRIVNEYDRAIEIVGEVR